MALKEIALALVALLASASLADALRCKCTTCEKTGYECETDGACMASTSYIQGREQHVRICISRDNLVPPGQSSYCLSAEGLLNTHCCYLDYCNSIEVPVPTKGVDPGSSWGPVDLVAVIAGLVFLLCVLLMVGVFLFQYHQRAYSHRQRLEVEDPSCDHLYLAKDKTLQEPHL